MKNNFEIKCRKIVESDWEYLPKWWESYPNWKGHSVPRDMLPGAFPAKMPGDITEEEAKTLGLQGFIVYKDEHNIAACWLYINNSKMSTICPVVANPDYRDVDRADALERLIHFTTHVAYDLGCTYAHALSTSKSLAAIFEKVGYEGEPCTELTIKL